MWPLAQNSKAPGPGGKNLSFTWSATQINSS